jgi:leucine dehydrogenase
MPNPSVTTKKFFDRETEITAILSYYGDSNLPAIGGCRIHAYKNVAHAEVDAQQLAKAMHLKAVAHDLPLSGAKCVCQLSKPITAKERWQFFQRLGKFFHKEEGRYIVAMDSGTSCLDMDAIATTTKYVCNHSAFGDPASYTAEGVIGTITMLARESLSSNLEHCTASLQGIGAVGMHVANHLSKSFGSLRVTDCHTALKRIIPKSAVWVQPQDIYCQKSDFFVPCALSQSITLRHLPLLNGAIIAGAANCPLSSEVTEQHLQHHSIRYVPDYIINGGGLIYCAAKFFKNPEWMKKINDIPVNSIKNINIIKRENPHAAD